MAAIYLIRHGQASFGKAEYDELSAKGCKQARILGNYWQNFSAPVKAYSGDLSRHLKTYDCFEQGRGQGEIPMKVHAGFNELDHVDILQNYNENWRDFSSMSESFAKQADANKKLQKEFSAALFKWISCKALNVYQESWTEFKQRCVVALNDVIQQHLAENEQAPSQDRVNDILIFTSGGTISVILQHILELSDQQMLRINQQLRNTSVSKILFSKNMLGVDYINNYSHLTAVGDDWITFR